MLVSSLNRSLYWTSVFDSFHENRWQEHIETAVKEAGGTADAQRSFLGTSGAPIVVQSNLTKTSAGVTILKPSSPDDEAQGESLFLMIRV